MGHSDSCPWRDEECNESLADCDVSPEESKRRQSALVEIFRKGQTPMLCKSLELDDALQTSGWRSVLCAPGGANDGPDDVAAVLALCGWNAGPSQCGKLMLACTSCGRQCSVGEHDEHCEEGESKRQRVENGSSSSAAIDPLGLHRWFCPWTRGGLGNLVSSRLVSTVVSVLTIGLLNCA